MKNSDYSEDQTSSKHASSQLNSKHRPSINHNPIIKLISHISKEHHHAFSTLEQKCLNAQGSINHLNQLASQLALRVQRFNEGREQQILSRMKMKQSQFIIGQLKSTISKQIKKQQALLEQLGASKAQVDKYKQENYKLEAKNRCLNQKLDTLEAQLHQQNAEYEELNKDNDKNEYKQTQDTANQQQSRGHFDYLDLQERYLQVSSQVKQEIDLNKEMTAQLEQLNSLKNELELKMKQQQSQLLDFQLNYKQVVEANKDSEVSLHKQIQQHKNKQIQLINSHKKQKRAFKQQLRMLADFIANGKYFFVKHEISDQIQEIRHLYEKSLKRKLEHETRELDYYQNQYKRTKLIAGQLQQKVHQMEKAKSVIVQSDKSMDSSSNLQRNCSQNGSTIVHHSSFDKSEQQKHKHLEQKYKIKMEALRKEIKLKNAKIGELERLEASQFDHNKEKILQFQMKISEKDNQIRKYQIEIKQKLYEIADSHQRINELQNKLKQINEKIQSQKEAHAMQIDLKSQTYEEKIKNLKTHYKEIEVKEQQKTIKYNLLKSNHQRYEQQVSESLKRKKIQIDQLLKQNQKYAAQIKQFQCKIHKLQSEQSVKHQQPIAQTQTQQLNKEIMNLKNKVTHLKQQRNQLRSELAQEKESKQRISTDLHRKISELSAKQLQLIDIINYKNRQGNSLRESMMGQQLVLQEQAKLKLTIDTMTDQIITKQMAINTDCIESGSVETQQRGNAFNQVETETYINKLFVPDEQQDNFQICDQEEIINIGRTSNNLELKESFNILRHSIQKLFNQEDITLSVTKLLPKQLEDDFHDFICYIKQKIHQIKNQNNLTFIMAEHGSQPSIESIEAQIQEFLAKPTTECIKLKKIIEEKECTITSLMNQKTQQENTINQQQNAQEQTQRLYLQQFSVLKKEIQQQKLTIDTQTAYYESIKNIFKKMMGFWLEDGDNYDDFEDNLKLIATIYKFNQKQLELQRRYLLKYKKLKQIQ